MANYIQKLPAVFQTVTEKKFFDATFDQVLSKKDSSLLSGYIGRRDPGSYNPITDFYIPEPSKNRTWWQLEATAYAQDESTAKTNVFFYDDLLERIDYYGGNTLNQDRLFESEYYSFGPPIDYDMFINYQNYYWISQDLPAIRIKGAVGSPIMGSDIVGELSYTTPSDATPPSLTLSSGMSIILEDDPEYADPHVVENFGNFNNCDNINAIGIQLVPASISLKSTSAYEFLYWDGDYESSDHRIIQNAAWDTNTWEVQSQPYSADYITIERGSANQNTWSRSNRWVHVNVINKSLQLNGITTFPSSAQRALRPIIQFSANLELYNSGSIFISDIKYGFRNDSIGNPMLLSNYQGVNLGIINANLGTDLQSGDLVCFFNDTTLAYGSNTVNHYIYIVSVDMSGNAVFDFYTSSADVLVNGNIVFTMATAPYNGASQNQTWYLDGGIWVQAYNDKTQANQPPLFQLYDHDGDKLNSSKYPASNFTGSEIFSYKVNNEPGATVDPVLGFPIVYTYLGQSSDIVFQNDLIATRYTYFPPEVPTSITEASSINGYYYYKTSTSPVLYNAWNLYDPCSCDGNYPGGECLAISKQRVIDKFVVGYGTQYEFRLSVTPYGYPSYPDIIVSVNGIEIQPQSTTNPYGYTITEINNGIYVVLTEYLSNLLLNKQLQPPVVEVQTYTHDLLNPEASGYFQIPQQLEANPTQLEVGDLSLGDLSPHFTSIIGNQIGFEGTAYGGPNNYRDTQKNESVGTYILQNVAPALKSMLISSSDDLDFITGVRFSNDEYTKFKNKYLNTATQLINSGFNPYQYHTGTIVINQWVDTILSTVNISKEFSNAFAYSYMVANGTPTYTETKTVPIGGLITLTNYVDLLDSKNAMYIYDASNNEYLLRIGVDYEILDYGNPSNGTPISIEIDTTKIPVGHQLFVYLYKNPLPAYIPSTPTKVGAYSVYLPRIELDTSYAIPTYVIIGHDGSKTITYSQYSGGVIVQEDYRDRLLLELETRIYNLLLSRFRDQYRVPLRVESVRSGYFRQTRYSRQEYLDITQSYINKWSTKNRADYRNNDWANASTSCPPASLWKLYNYTDAIVNLTPPPGGTDYYLPGNWKGIFQYYYDTYYPDTRPWEMLGLSDKPYWWETEYGAPVLNIAGQEVWTSASAGLHNLWADLEAGIIRQGPSAIIDPYTLEPQPQEMWARPGLSNIIPVDTSGEIINVVDLFQITYSGNPYAPFAGFDKPWVYGDGGPVEQAWMSTSSYVFDIQEFLYLMRPGPFGELLWDTAGTSLSPGQLVSYGPVSNNNWQYVQNDFYLNDTYTNTDEHYLWMRPKNSQQTVHAEIVDGNIQVRYGYQRWISDRILFLGKDIATVFGQKIRTLNVNLANKFAGFTNKDTTNTYIEAVTPGALTNSLILPSTNFQVLLHKSQPVDRYAYSGVIIRGLADGTFVVYGYDLLTAQFNVLDRSNQEIYDITVGGTPAEFRYYESNTTYKAGEIVRYNSVYYVSLVTQTVQNFGSGEWQKLATLPISGGLIAQYKPISEPSITVVPYGTVFDTYQEVFDFLIGWGAYLESQGWIFDEVNQETNIVNDWLYSAKQFLFWLNTNWAPDASIQLSPMANRASLVVKRGYPDDVETISNGVYSILDKFGVAISPINTTIDRDGPAIIVSPSEVAAGGIFFLQVHASETEHILIFDNTTSFNDIIYSPLLRARQQRLRFYGFRSNGWYGKMEAPGYLVLGNQLVPNFDTIVDNMRYYYDANVAIDNPSLEAMGRHLIGYDSKSYLDNLEVSNDVQYLFYQGAIRQKGTKQAFEKLFRSTKVQSNELIEVYEEWALKLGDFGNTIEQVSTEFILKPEQNTGEVIVARLNFRPSSIGFVREIKILNAVNVYTQVPQITIDEPNATPPGTFYIFSPAQTYYVGDIVRYDDPNGNPVYYSSNITQSGPFIESNWTIVLKTVRATAYAILGSDGRISRIDMIDPGYGYLNSPKVQINPNASDADILYSVWQGEIIKDTTADNIVDIDIDQKDIWTVVPPNPSYSLQFPLTDRVEYSIPNAGYVNFNDVDLYSFDVTQTYDKWGTEEFNPSENQTIWVAKNFIQDWSVYKLLNFNHLRLNNSWRLVKATSGELLLLTPYSAVNPDDNVVIVPQLSQTNLSNRTDFGSLVVLQEIISDVALVDNNFTVNIIPYASSDYANPGTYVVPVELVEYNAYTLTDLSGTPLTEQDIPNYQDINRLLLYKTMRFPVAPPIPLLPRSLLDDYIWVDDVNGKWAVLKINGDPSPWDTGQSASWDFLGDGWDVAEPLYYTTHREQAPLINTSLFQSASVFATSNNNQLVQLPIYDPFKDIFPAIAKQNITYILQEDPARYNVTGDNRLFSNNIIFGEDQVGQLWWDTSSTRYVYYEQPLASDETELENLVYRRNNWGKLFPGSTIKIYEWVKSDTPPSEYRGTGIPRDTTTYVKISTANRFTNVTQVNYYFWVLNTTDKPNIENRTLTALDVSLLLQTPKSIGFYFFSPIQQTANNNCYMFYNVQSILAYRGDNVQIQYRVTERDDQKHTQWMFFREGDPRSIVTDQYWNKMVDSLCGYTAPVIADENQPNAILLSAWDALPWDVEPWDETYMVLPVPDPMLGPAQRYGIQYRPRQGMFKNLTAARKVFVQSANNLLQYIPIRDNNPEWRLKYGVEDPGTFWDYTNWYIPGYENATPNSIFDTLQEAIQALPPSGNLMEGDIVQVLNGIQDPDNSYRFVLYVVVKSNTNTYSLEEIGSEKSSVKLLDTVYTTENRYNLSAQLRELLNSFRSVIMINNYVVDQNELFFSMLNYVFSEQKTPDWAFKSSYIYVKESNVPLTQNRLYIPDQIGNIIDYINDNKPYHTQIRDYSSSYTPTTDNSIGVASDPEILIKVHTIDPANPSAGKLTYNIHIVDNGDQVFYRNNNPADIIPGESLEPQFEVWNAASLPAVPDTTTETSPGAYTSITNISAGGLWTANTTEASYLRASPEP